jgi:hypothetical protein
MRQPRLGMPRPPWRLAIGQGGPAPAPEEPLADGVHLVLHLALRWGPVGRTERERQPIVPRDGDRLGMQLAAEAHGVLAHRLRALIPQVVRPAAKAGKGRLMAGPKGAQILPVRLLDRGVAAVTPRQMDPLARASLVPPDGLRITPIPLGLLPGGRFEAPIDLHRPRRPQPSDHPRHTGRGAGNPIMGPQGLVAPHRPHPRRPRQPRLDPGLKGAQRGGAWRAAIARRRRRVQGLLHRPPIQAHPGPAWRDMIAVPCPGFQLPPPLLGDHGAPPRPRHKMRGRWPMVRWLSRRRRAQPPQEGPRDWTGVDDQHRTP